MSEDVEKFSGILAMHDAPCATVIDREWVADAIVKIEADAQRSSDTHLFQLPLKNLEGIEIYLKDESTHLTGSLKHRLARSLILYGICNGKVGRNSTLVEASSGSTAVSEAYFAQLLKLEFVAVVPRGTSDQKLDAIRRYGGQIREVDAHLIYAEANRLAKEKNGYYLDQFTNAERATDWRSNNNIAESLFQQMENERHSVPSWIVVGAGTGGTAATIGRYIRFKAKQFEQTRLCVADPENSVFFEGFQTGREDVKREPKSRIEGVGRPRVEPSFLPTVIDRMIKIKDEASMATSHWLAETTGRYFGPSTGLNVYCTLALAREMQQRGDEGSLVCLGCDDGHRYRNTCFDAEWLKQNKLEVAPFLSELRSF